MRRGADNVKRLAWPLRLWHMRDVSKKTDTEKSRRLAEALRANLRRRKEPAKESETCDLSNARVLDVNGEG